MNGMFQSIIGRLRKRRPPEPSAGDMAMNLPEGINTVDVARLGVASLSSGDTFDALEAKLQEIGLNQDAAGLAAERIASGMTRAFMPNPVAAPDGAKDPIARAAYDLARETTGLT